MDTSNTSPRLCKGHIDRATGRGVYRAIQGAEVKPYQVEILQRLKDQQGKRIVERQRSNGKPLKDFKEILNREIKERKST